MVTHNTPKTLELFEEFLRLVEAADRRLFTRRLLAQLMGRTGQ